MENKFIKNITENNIHDAIEYYYGHFNNYVDAYRAISENLIVKEYHSITSNFSALFLHHVMKNYVDISEFDKIIKTIYDSNVNLEHTFYRFFGLSGLEHSLQEFLNLPDEKKDADIWEHLNYFFLDLKNNSCTLAPDKIHYLQSMCRHLPPAHIMALHGSGFVGYLSQCSKNVEDLKLLFQTIQNNAVFGVAVKKQHPSFLSSFFTNVSHEAYFLSEEEKIDFYNKLERVIDNNEKLFLSKLIQYSEKHESAQREFKLDYGLLKFIDVIGSDKVISHIDHVYQAAINYEWNDEDRRKNLYQIESRLANDIASSLEVGFKKLSFSLNLDNIDTERSFYRNYIYIKLLEILIENNLNPKVPQSIRDYIEKEIQIDESGPFEELTFLIDKKLLRNYFKFAELNELLPNMESNQKSRLKI